MISYDACPTPAFSAPRHPTKPENTKSLRGAGALERFVRLVCWLEILGGVPHSNLRPYDCALPR